MVIFAIIMPAVVLVILGFLYQTKPAFPGADYTFQEQSMSAVCAISICAGGLMGLPLVVAGYRERKILKRFWVTPISPVMLLGVEFTVYVLYAAGSMALVFPMAVVFWGVRLPGSPAAFLGSWLLTLFSTLSMGMMVGGLTGSAWRVCLDTGSSYGDRYDSMHWYCGEIFQMGVTVFQRSKEIRNPLR